MSLIHPAFFALPDTYLFRRVEHETQAYLAAHPEERERLISLGIGDVPGPLSPAVVRAMQDAATELGRAESFRGYASEPGYPFLRTAIADHLRGRGADICEDEVFISDGAKRELGDLLELFTPGVRVLLCDPTYPVYAEVCQLHGAQLRTVLADESNAYLPLPDDTAAPPPDLIFLCSPANPTGVAYDRGELARWVDYANAHGSVLIFDSAYEAFAADPTIPHSIFEIPGARHCAIEVGSLSKSAGFTGTRCGYTLISRELYRDGYALRDLWTRRLSTRSNGVAYIVQRGAQAAYSPEGQADMRAHLAVFRENAAHLADALTRLGLSFVGGRHAPYLWVHCPEGMNDFTFFRHLLARAQIIATPGSGFGRGGENYVRLSALTTPDRVAQAAERLSSLTL